jgi:FkbM family methyltransferase
VKEKIRAALHRWGSWFVGKWVEWSGNRVKYPGGIVIDVSNEAISPAEKCTLVTNTFEVDEIALMNRHLDPGSRVIELGAGIGVLSCIINRRLEDPSRHVAVEANPVLVPTLRRNQEINGCAFEIVEAAVAYDGETVWFPTAWTFVGNSLLRHDGGDVRVEATTLSELLFEGGEDPAFLVCDVEGMEYDLVRREADVLGERVEGILMEVHPRLLGADRVEGMMTRLSELGFEEVDRRGDAVVLRKRNLD